MNIIFVLLFKLAWFCSVVNPQPKPIQYYTMAELSKNIDYKNPKTKYFWILDDDKVLVKLDMRTGHAELYGDPNEAAKAFWRAVEANR